MFHAETWKLDTTHKTLLKDCVLQISKLALAVTSSFFASMNMQSGAYLPDCTQYRQGKMQIHQFRFIKLKSNCGHLMAVDMFERHIYMCAQHCVTLHVSPWNDERENTNIPFVRNCFQLKKKKKFPRIYTHLSLVNYLLFILLHPSVQVHVTMTHNLQSNMVTFNIITKSLFW